MEKEAWHVSSSVWTPALVSLEPGKGAAQSSVKIDPEVQPVESVETVEARERKANFCIDQLLTQGKPMGPTYGVKGTANGR